MIYFDNSATTWPKPDRVYRGVYEFMKKYGVNPGRSNYDLAAKAQSIVYSCRELLCDYLGMSDPSSVIFTKNATEALNIVIKGILKPGDHAICSSMEHNSVLRPLDKLSENGVKFDIVWADREGYINPDDIEQKICKKTKLIVINHVSNICGSVQDISKIGKIAHKYGILFAVDASQSCGLLKINMSDIDFLCTAGHKALYGPMGTGVLCINTSVHPDTCMEGGTGSYSQNLVQPDELPDKYESGTLNAAGIAGLLEGVKFIEVVGCDEILQHEISLTAKFLNGLKNIHGITVYGPSDELNRTGVVLFNKEGIDCVEFANILDKKYNIACRAGYHCAYNAHVTVGSGDSGALRFSFGRFNTKDEVDKALFAISHI